MLLQKLIHEEKKHFVNRTMNKIAKGKKRWWKAMKDVTDIQKNRTDNYFLKDKWMKAEELAVRLNKYFAGVG